MREPYLPEMRFAFTNYGVSVGLQAVGAMPDRVERLNAYFERYRSGDEYDSAAITHVMACKLPFPGAAAAARVTGFRSNSEREHARAFCLRYRLLGYLSACAGGGG